MDKLDLNSVFEELDAINEEELGEAGYPEYFTDRDFALLERMAPWWFVSRCYHDYVDPSEVRWTSTTQPKDASREASYRTAHRENRVKSILLKVLQKAAKHQDNMERAANNKHGVSGYDLVDMATAVLEVL